MEKKTTLSFTAEELRILYFALNAYAVHNMQESKTWGNAEAYRDNGLRRDVWHREAEDAGRLQTRVYEAEKRIAK